MLAKEKIPKGAWQKEATQFVHVPYSLPGMNHHRYFISGTKSF
jgi:hypothetical protein